MINNNDNRVKYYDNILNNYTSFNNIIHNVQYNIHNKLYKIALNSLLREIYTKSGSSLTFDAWLSDFYKKHKIMEIKTDNYKDPSTVRIYSCVFPYTKTNYSLKNYWPNTFEERKKYFSMLMLDEETLKYSELTYINYIDGKCLLQNKLTGITFEIPIEYLDDTIAISDDLKLNSNLIKRIY